MATTPNRQLVARLQDIAPADVTLSVDLGFHWSCTSTPVGGGSPSFSEGTGAIYAGNSEQVLYQYDDTVEVISALVIETPSPTPTDGHNIVAI